MRVDQAARICREGSLSLESAICILLYCGILNVLYVDCKVEITEFKWPRILSEADICFRKKLRKKGKIKTEEMM